MLLFQAWALCALSALAAQPYCSCANADLCAPAHCVVAAAKTQTDLIADSALRRSLSRAALSRSLNLRDASKSFDSVLSSAFNLTRSAAQPWTLMESWRSEKAEDRSTGGLFVSARDALITLDADQTWMQTCDRRFPGSTCFPVAFMPALVALQSLEGKIDRAVLATTSSAVAAAFPLLVEKAPKALKEVFIENHSADFVHPTIGLAPETCLLLCPTLLANVPVATFEAQGRAPVVGAPYIYVPLPGALERLLWLTALACVVVVGSWQGKYQLTLS